MLAEILKQTGFWPAIGTGGVVVVVTVLVLRWLLPRLRKLGHLIDDLAGEPARPGVACRPGLMERVACLEARTEELVHNSGVSIKDVVGRLDQTTVRLDERLADVERHTRPRERG